MAEQSAGQRRVELAQRSRLASKWLKGKERASLMAPPSGIETAEQTAQRYWDAVLTGTMDAVKVVRALMEEVRKIAGKDGGLDLKLVFKEFDLDGSGSIDMQELDAALRSLGVDLPAKYLELAFSMFDRDGGGCDYGEFCRVYYDRRTDGTKKGTGEVQAARQQEEKAKKERELKQRSRLASKWLKGKERASLMAPPSGIETAEQTAQRELFETEPIEGCEESWQESGRIASSGTKK